MPKILPKQKSKTPAPSASENCHREERSDVAISTFRLLRASIPKNKSPLQNVARRRKRHDSSLI